MPLRQPKRSTLLLKTGQTTQYDSELDDGYYEKGIAKSYAVLTTGQHSGTSNIDLIHLTVTTISFDAGTKEIRDSGNGLTMFKTGETIVITGDSDNNGTYTIVTGNVAGVIVVSEALSDEAAGDTVNIAKREAHSNNCALDQNTGWMWNSYGSSTYATMGAAGDGKMPWTGELYDIFQYCAAANSASLGGYTDWRIPNDFELASLKNMEAPNAVPDATAFPGWTAGYVWSSTTLPNNTTYAMPVYFIYGSVPFITKSTAYYSVLVRG